MDRGAVIVAGKASLVSIQPITLLSASPVALTARECESETERERGFIQL